VRLTVVCTDTDTPYSGMLPGYIAGHYGFDEVHIDLRRLAEFAGARYFRDEVVGIDRARARCSAARGRRCPTTRCRSTSARRRSSRACRRRRARGAGEADPPLQRTLAGAARARPRARRATTIAVVGAGAGGVELTLAMQYRLRGELAALGRDPDELRFHLFSADARSCRRTTPPCAAPSSACWPSAGVTVHRGAEVVDVAAGCLRARNGDTLDADEIVWVTQAGGAPGCATPVWRWTRPVSSASATRCRARPIR
jgi:selenide,water dikinase